MTPTQSGVPSRLEAWLNSVWPLFVAALVTSLVVTVVWGGLRPYPVMHDEWAYWAQAGQYSHLRWSVPAPPIPEFFEQFYLLTTPVFAAKYPPGHALSIAAGFGLGLPALMPILMNGAAGALVFALARRLGGARLAGVTLVLWLGAAGTLRFRASYFSEITTTVCVLGAWWSLFRWRERKELRWMVALALCIGWGAITRPFTLAVFAIPIGGVVLRDVSRERLWRTLALGVVTGCVVLLILPLWNARTTGDVRTTPLALYTKQYIPFDLPGFSLNSTPPERALPPEMDRTRRFLKDVKVAQIDTPIWRSALLRTAAIFIDLFSGTRLPFMLTCLAGMFVVRGAARWALGSSLLLVVAHLAQAHTADWTVYYLEATPALAFASAVGAAALLRRFQPLGAPRWTEALIAVALVFGIVQETVKARSARARLAQRTVEFREFVGKLPRSPNIVFVRYAMNRNMHLALVANDGILDSSPSWIVHDRGEENQRLLTLAPTRAAYLFDEAAGEFREVRP